MSTSSPFHGKTNASSHAQPVAEARAVLASFGKHVRYAIGQATELIDADSAALFTEISRGIDTWLVEAHLRAVQ